MSNRLYVRTPTSMPICVTLPISGGPREPEATPIRQNHPPSLGLPSLCLIESYTAGEASETCRDAAETFLRRKMEAWSSFLPDLICHFIDSMDFASGIDPEIHVSIKVTPRAS